MKQAEQGNFEHVCYHGTRAETPFECFNVSSTGAQGPGIYLADRVESAAQYGGGRMVIEARVALRNPFWFYPSDESLDAEANIELLEQVLDATTLALVLQRMEREGMAGYGFEVMQSLRERGHDGVVVVYPFGKAELPGASGEAVVIAFEPGQVEILRRAPARDACWQVDGAA
ncbi:hypothetical protein [Paraburkholderia sp. J8-2]|uniref:ADP-ribosyltransferase-containing protein n=1 Tax=Paraburkholderia sp. J8-2 TaxID=2805440 RepID=UPI002AB6FE4E|nr:hypothetical protein [Paraburkholderia sp. J8-2]